MSRHLPLLAFVILAVIGGLYLNGQVEERIQANIGSCEVAKEDRIDSARAWTQAEITWSQRATDKALPQSEQELAQKTAVIYGESANQLRSRLYDCDALVRDRRQVLDDRALREAQGEI